MEGQKRLLNSLNDYSRPITFKFAQFLDIFAKFERLNIGLIAQAFQIRTNSNEKTLDKFLISRFL